jgi:hypothetical protein
LDVIGNLPASAARRVRFRVPLTERGCTFRL